VYCSYDECNFGLWFCCNADNRLPRYQSDDKLGRWIRFFDRVVVQFLDGDLLNLVDSEFYREGDGVSKFA